MHIVGAIYLMSLILIPSISRLFFGVKSDIVLKTVAGDVRPISSSGGLGLGGIKSSGSRVVGRIELEMLTPTVAKKLLNSLAIWLLSCV